ncbi:MAG: hypothetical protein IT201_01120 [Thermoleophilia bacterium]|nr:hypothetical protein [Thermoleophilia bacterium]
MTRVLVPVLVCTALVPVAWLELEATAESPWRLGGALALALAPALVLAVTRRLAVALAALLAAGLGAASLALGVPLTDMRPGGERDFFGSIAAAMADGFLDVYEARAPFDRADHPELAGLVLLAVFLGVAAGALLAVRCRVLPFALVLVVAVGVPATVAVEGGIGRPLRTGALVLGGLLISLFVSRERAPGLRATVPAVGLGAALVAVAIAVSTSEAVAKPSFVSWQRWDLYDRPSDPVGVRYVWASNYAGITFPEEPTVVLRVGSSKRPLYWRATTLDEYTGVAWRERLRPGPLARGLELDALAGDPLAPDVPEDDESLIRQEVEIVALADTHLLAASQPVRFSLPGTAEVELAPGGVVLQPAGLERGQSYTVWSYAPRIEPKELAALPAEYPAELAPYLEVIPDVTFPAFGTAGHNRAVRALFRERAGDELLAAYEPVYGQARELVGAVESPYLAAVTLESWFRQQGGFVYDERPEQPDGQVPPLADFILRTREGYCQHYAGAMALMLRLIGIPARVAAGFTSGAYDSARGEWVVTDHNAHTWVEVWFPTYGWLTFDPTPGRGRLEAAYAPSSIDFEVNDLNALGVAPSALSPLLREQLLRAARGATDPDRVGEGGGGTNETGAAGGDGGLGLPLLVLVAVAGAAALPPLVKRAVSMVRFAGRDPRRTASACRRGLVGFLADQRLDVSPGATLEELGSALEQRFGVDTAPFVRAAGAARFGPPAVAAEAARRARRELAALERQLARSLGAGRRVRGAFSLRSLVIR